MVLLFSYLSVGDTPVCPALRGRRCVCPTSSHLDWSSGPLSIVPQGRGSSNVKSTPRFELVVLYVLKSRRTRCVVCHLTLSSSFLLVSSEGPPPSEPGVSDRPQFYQSTRGSRPTRTGPGVGVVVVETVPPDPRRVDPESRPPCKVPYPPSASGRSRAPPRLPGRSRKFRGRDGPEGDGGSAPAPRQAAPLSSNRRLLLLHVGPLSSPDLPSSRPRPLWHPGTRGRQRKRRSHLYSHNSGESLDHRWIPITPCPLAVPTSDNTG